MNKIDLTALDAQAQTPIEKPLAIMDKLRKSIISSKATIESMKRSAQSQVNVLPIALRGQATALYMVYNGGKTLLAFRWTCDSIAARRIDGKNVYYILADDDYNGSIEKAELAEEHGFNLVVPGMQEGGIRADEIPELLDSFATSGCAVDQIIIMDTLKKLVSMMDKTKTAKLGEIVRRFVQSGGTFVALGHINKHRGDDGKPVYEGTGDIVNDFDCAYVGSIDTPKDEPQRQVTFQNIKLRGNVPSKLSVTYNSGKDQSWRQKFDSVSIIDEEQAAKRAQALRDQQQLESDFEAVQWIRAQLKGGAKNTSTIRTTENAPLGQKKIKDLLHRYDETHRNRYFRYWTSKAGAKNAQLWTLTDNNPEALNPVL